MLLKHCWYVLHIMLDSIKLLTNLNIQQNTYFRNQIHIILKYFKSLKNILNGYTCFIICLWFNTFAQQLHPSPGKWQLEMATLPNFETSTRL